MKESIMEKKCFGPDAPAKSEAAAELRCSELPSERKPYQKPRLTELGSIGRMTRGGLTVPIADSGSFFTS